MPSVQGVWNPKSSPSKLPPNALAAQLAFMDKLDSASKADSNKLPVGSNPLADSLNAYVNKGLSGLDYIARNRKKS